MCDTDILQLYIDRVGWFRKDGQFNTRLVSGIQKREDLRDMLEKENVGRTISERLYNRYYGNVTIPACPFCHKLLNFVSFKHGYREYCSDRSCINKNSRDEIWKRMQQTHQKRYGTSYGNAQVTKEKREKTLLLKYDVRNPMQVADFQEKNHKTRMSLEYLRMRKKCIAGGVLPLFTSEDYEGVLENYAFKCLVCGNTFTTNLAYDKATLYSNIPRCHACNPVITGKSVWESEVKDWASQQFPGISIQTNVRTIIPPYELDLFFPDYSLAIELNGNFWHSEIGGGKDKTYHLTKTELCIDNNIRIIQIFQDEWEDTIKRDIIKSIIVSIVSSNTLHRIFARKCEIRNVVTKEARIFLTANHLQGFVGGQDYLGLYFDNRLVALLVMGKSRFSHNYELLRYANLVNYRVVGGFSRLFKHWKILKDRAGIKVDTYADRRFFTGESYRHVGFTFIKNTSPNYYYVRASDYGKRLSRVNFQKHKLPNVLPRYDKGLTEWENMRNNKYDRIWDCGNAYWQLCL
jgi:hypothetical protein